MAKIPARLLGRAALLFVAALVAGLATPGARAAGDACGFDLYVLADGQARDITNSPFACEFRPEWSPSRKQVVDNRIEDGAQTLSLLDVGSGVSTPIPGGADANNASWSPNGRLLAFDRIFVGDANAYVLPPAGGTPTLIRSDAVDLDWAPSSQRLAFVQPSDGSIHTIGLDGSGETTVAPPGLELPCLPIECGLAWSPNGRLIAYSDVFDIWTVRVTPDGAPLGPPTLVLAGGPFYNTQLSWAGDGKAIVFNSDRAGDGGSALWSIPAGGGTPERIAGTPSQFNYDASVARGGGAIVYSGSTP